MEEFFDRVKKGIDKGVAIVGAKSKEIVESTKIRNQIAAFEDRKQETFEEIGKIVYRMYREPDYQGETEMREKCEVLADFDRQIEEKEVELRKVHQQAQEEMGKVICESCGNPLVEGSRFCSHCGAKVVQVEKAMT